MESMMKLVGPLSIQRIATPFEGRYISRIIQIEFSYENFFSSAFFLHILNFFRKLVDKMSGAKIPDSMYCIYSKAVNMKFIQPHECILPVKISHTIAPRIIEIDGFSPVGFVFVSKVGSVFAKVITFWSLVVVHHIQNHCNTFAMSSIY